MSVNLWYNPIAMLKYPPKLLWWIISLYILHFSLCNFSSDFKRTYSLVRKFNTFTETRTHYKKLMLWNLILLKTLKLYQRVINKSVTYKVIFHHWTVSRIFSMLQQMGKKIKLVKKRAFIECFREFENYISFYVKIYIFKVILVFCLKFKYFSFQHNNICFILWCS